LSKASITIMIAVTGKESNATIASVMNRSTRSVSAMRYIA
jgi:hypothetical protein